MSGILKPSIPRGIMDFNPRAIILDQKVREEFELLKNNANQKNILLVNDVKKNFIVTADENMLQVILRNLITNAIKFTSKNGQILVSATAKDEEVVISVSDNGLGMTQETMEQLFSFTLPASCR